MISNFLTFFGLKTPAGVTPVDNCAAIADIFKANAARQQSESAFFSTGAGVPKFLRGHSGAKLNFSVPDHLK
jgi:hypothetical protein